MDAPTGRQPPIAGGMRMSVLPLRVAHNRPVAGQSPVVAGGPRANPIFFDGETVGKTARRCHDGYQISNITIYE